VGDGLFAYLQPDGGWGWSNAGLIVDGEATLLVDTLFDLKLTGEMLAAMRKAVPAAAEIDTLVNTHANGDHCWGNELVPEGTAIWATAAAAQEMTEVTPELFHAMAVNDLGPELNDFYDYAFGRFEFGDITLTLPTDTFSERHALTVGGRQVELIEVGPTHTRGDTFAHVPDAGVLFTGDVLFVEGTPIMWAGPSENWIAACDLICALSPHTIVPGHGPVCGLEGPRAVQAYLRWVRDAVGERHAGGMTDPLEIALDLDLGPFADLRDAERIVVNAESMLRELDPGRPPPSPVDLFTGMQRWRRERRSPTL
jgi:glyoxylase-like metal-dependent hydrolase (beta-lactamase superfamily II)